MLSEARLLDRLEGSVFVHSFVVADLAQHIGDRLERAVVGGERDVIGVLYPIADSPRRGSCTRARAFALSCGAFPSPFIGNSIDRNRIE